MAQFVNAKQDLVKESIDGLLACSGGALARIDGYPHIKVVIRADWDKSRVAVISGGGSGHEPAHAGFVGPGMLTATVCGEIFASPSVEAVLAGILAVTGEAGCLSIVKNYTGDRLNFGLAAERARALGHTVEKVASIGTSLDTCTIPGSPKELRIPAGKAELGLGIHGEPGVEQVGFSGAADALALVLDKLRPHFSDGPNVVLVNDLGATTPLEMSVLCHGLARAGIASHVIGPAAMRTSLDMHGFSLSVFPVDGDEWDALAAPVPIAAWPGLRAIVGADVRPLPEGLSPIKPIASSHEPTRKMVERVARVLIEAEARLNELDAKSGDGDTGSTLAVAAQALKNGLDNLPLADPTRLFPALGNELAQTMGGSSGVILAIYFSAAGEACARGATVERALLEGMKRVSDVGGHRSVTGPCSTHWRPH